jgi:hypothetical protein
MRSWPGWAIRGTASFERGPPSDHSPRRSRRGGHLLSGSCRSLCVGGKGGKVVQRIKSCRRRLHHPEKLTSGPRIAASMERAKNKPAICAGRARICAKAQLSPTLRPTTMCCPPMRNLVDDSADRIVQADVARVPILDRRNSKVVGLVARRDPLSVRARLLREESQRSFCCGCRCPL